MLESRFRVWGVGVCMSVIPSGFGEFPKVQGAHPTIPEPGERVEKKVLQVKFLYSS